MKKKIPLGVAIALMMIIASVSITVSHVFSLNHFNRQYANVERMQSIYSRLAEIDSRVSQSFLNEVDTDAVMDGIARGYISALGDRWATYMSREEYRLSQQATSGHRVGIGITINRDVDSEYIYVTRVMAGSPAYEAGIQSGDLIVEVAGQNVNDIGYFEAVDAILGDEGTVASFVVRRGEELIPFNIERREHVIISVFHNMIGNIGYIKITDFADNTPEQFSQAIEELQSAGAVGLVFDVRNNGGGTLNAVEEMLDKLLPAGVVVTAEFTGGEVREVFASSANREVDMPMAVVTNGSSASASELFAAAIREMGDGILVGERTYGKGVMQQTFVLSDNSAIRFTVARFRPPSGVSFDEIGIYPDIEVSLTEEDLRYFHRLTPEQDPQIMVAVEALQS